MTKIRRKQNDPYLEAHIANIKTYDNFYLRLAQIALSMFEWENLPVSMNGQWLEWCLFSQGMAALLYTKEYGFINTQATVRGKLNIYGLPISLECYSFGFNQARKVYDGLQSPLGKEEECILVDNMLERIPTLPTLELFAMRLTEAQRSEDVNIKAQKTPIVILTEEKKRLTVINAYEQISGNTPVVIGDKNSLDLEGYKVLDTKPPYVADKLQLYRRKIWQEALEFLGVNCIVDQKKERLVADEANGNNEVINLNMQNFLVPRQRACRYFNEKYGLVGTDKEISVKVRSDLLNTIKKANSVVSDLISSDESDNV